MNSEPAPGTDRRALIFNLTLFCITGLALTIYSWVFAAHIANGLASSTLDELVWAATLCSTVFYGTAVYQSYTAYVRRNGPSFSIGPFTILSSSLLPSATTATVPGAISISSPMVNSTPRSNSNFKFENNIANAYPDSPSTPRASVELSVCPPTPDTPMSNQSTPMLITPQMDRSYAPHSPSPAARNKIRFGGMMKRKSDSFEDDIERGSEMHGLGMGAIGSDVHIVRV